MSVKLSTDDRPRSTAYPVELQLVFSLVTSKEADNEKEANGSSGRVTPSEFISFI